MTTALITAPASEPVSLADAKAHLRVDHDHEDQLIADTLRAARQHTEFASNSRFLTQAWRQYDNGLGSDRTIQLRVWPVQEIAAVTLFDRDGTPTVLGTDDYRLVRGHSPAALVVTPHIGIEKAANGAEIDIVAGFGDLGLDVPGTLRRAILLLLAHWYEFRGAIPPSQQPVSLPPGFETLVRGYRRVNL